MPISLSNIKELLDAKLSKVTPKNWKVAIEHTKRFKEFIFEIKIKIDSRLSDKELATLKISPV